MPDWTYHPLRGIAAAMLGARRSRRLALRTLAAVGSLPGGARLIAQGLGHHHPDPSPAGTVAGVPVRARVGVVVPPSVAWSAVRAMAPLGAGLVEVAPVRPADVPEVRRAAAGRRVAVFARAAPDEAPMVEAALSGHVDGVLHGAEPEIVRTSSPSVDDAAQALEDPHVTVLAMPEVLVEAGPGWFARVVEAATPTEDPGPPAPGRDPRLWPNWWWGVLVGLGVIAFALGAAVVTLGPVLLWYDRDFLGAGPYELREISHHLPAFLRHDRITLAGSMVAIGVLYAGIAFGGLRRRWPWARRAFLATGTAGFLSWLYFIGFGFLEPLHTAATVILLPMFLLAMRRDPGRPRWRVLPEGPEPVRRRALTGQLLMVITGFGLLVGGIVVSVVGMTGVFVPSDLEFLGVQPDTMRAANARLVPFVAHDRATFGGALVAAGVAITLLSLWAWRRGEAWLWWVLAGAAGAGFVPAVAVHGAISYNDLGHLAPVYLGIGLTVTALGLARPYLCVRVGTPAPTNERILPDRPDQIMETGSRS
ncbi:hypothetical protein ACIBEJ_06630 [Nonomuraea sp. NPDC050790]|uniref:hypothetical protein n=1 Tax=Nonomuraea sp. NPDC050790 TaxID=3364371 RepID=UPI0037AA92DB